MSYLINSRPLNTYKVFGGTLSLTQSINQLNKQINITPKLQQAKLSPSS